MDEFTEDNSEDIIPGQMGYEDLLEMIKEEPKIEEEKKIEITPGQISFDNLEIMQEKTEKVNNDFKGNEEKMEEKNFNDLIEEEKKEKNESILEEIETDKKSRKSTMVDNGDGIFVVGLEEVLHNSMIPYTEHVVLDRALPRVEDGLKPVQRRILYTMLELGLEPDKQFRKSARIVGDCMGKYHPHGDSSVYDAMVRMAQTFSMNEPLVLGHGNFGSIDGDSAAAMRYTEAKLTPLAMEMLRDLDKNTVRWILNFDDTLKEPAMLPGRFPNLLVNGTSGIAVGVATNIPPHNLNEVIEGVVAYIDNPKITLDEMMKIIKGPDFPTGGIIIAGEELKQAYETGKGKIILRAKTHFEEKGDKKSIVITEVPYQTNKAALLQKIAELREGNKGMLSYISEIRDESDRTGLRAVIRLKKEANAEAVLRELFKSTGLQTTFGINMVAIADGKPKQKGLLDIISYYVEYQREVVFRRTKFELDGAKDRAHILEGLLVAIKNIDEVIKIIKTSASVAEAKLRLRNKFDLSEKQAQAILDMRLARLVNLEVNKIIAELEELKEKIAKLTKIYESKRLQLGVVKSEISDIKKRFKSHRLSAIDTKTQIKEEVKRVEPVYIETECYVAVCADGGIKNISLNNYNKSQKDITETSTISHIHTQIQKLKSTDNILIFTNKGNCLKTQVGNIPESKWKDRGVALKTIDKRVGSDETVVKFVVLTPEIENKQFIFFTSSGMVKKSDVKEYIINKAYFQAIKLKDNEKLVGVEIFKDGGGILYVSKLAMALHFEKTDIPVQGRVSGGVKGMNIDEGDEIIFGTQINKGGNLTVITDNGFAKKVNIAEFGLSARYRKGLRAISLGAKSKGLVYASFGEENEQVALSLGDKLTVVNNFAAEARTSEGKQKVHGKVSSAHIIRL